MKYNQVMFVLLKLICELCFYLSVPYLMQHLFLQFIWQYVLYCTYFNGFLLQVTVALTYQISIVKARSSVCESYMVTRMIHSTFLKSN